MFSQKNKKAGKGLINLEDEYIKSHALNFGYLVKDGLLDISRDPDTNEMIPLTTLKPCDNP